MAERSGYDLLGRVMACCLCLFHSLPIGVAAETPSPDEKRFRIYRNVPLTQREHGMNGSLQLLQDSRLTPEHRRMQPVCDWPVKHPALWQPFRDIPPRASLVRLVDKARDIRDFAQFPPFTELTPIALYRTPHPTYMVTYDTQACGEPIRERVTTFADIRQGHLSWLQSRDGKNQESRPLRLVQSAQAAWRFDPPLGKSSARRGRDILEVHSRLNVFAGGSSPAGSIVVYRRYHFDGHVWLKSERTVEGIWESTRHFPERSKFP